MKLSLSRLVALAAGLLISNISQAYAFGGRPGGPFSNGNYFPNEGTFSAVIRGQNLSGILQFSTGGAGPIPEGGQVTGAFEPYDTQVNAIGGMGSSGVATIYYDGDTFLGNSQGAYNPSASSLSVNFQASLPGQDQQDVSVQDIVATTFDAVDGEADPTQFAYSDVIRYLYTDSTYFSGFANCKTSNAIPNQKFAGSGEAQLRFLDFSTGEPTLAGVYVPLSITGIRLSNVATTFSTRIVTSPSVNTVSVIAP